MLTRDASHAQDHARPVHRLLSAPHVPPLDMLPTMLESVFLSVVMASSLALKPAIPATSPQLDVPDAESRPDGPAQDSPQSADQTLPLPR
jgi:hypothetical protein